MERPKPAGLDLGIGRLYVDSYRQDAYRIELILYRMTTEDVVLLLVVILPLLCLTAELAARLPALWASLGEMAERDQKAVEYARALSYSASPSTTRKPHAFVPRATRLPAPASCPKLCLDQLVDLVPLQLRPSSITARLRDCAAYLMSASANSNDPLGGMRAGRYVSSCVCCAVIGSLCARLGAKRHRRRGGSVTNLEDTPAQRSVQVPPRMAVPIGGQELAQLRVVQRLDEIMSPESDFTA